MAAQASSSGVPTPENLKYLKEQRICERLESMVRHVLLTRPEDPVLAMCNYVNDSNRAGTPGVRYAAPSIRTTRTTNTTAAASRPASSDAAHVSVGGHHHPHHAAHAHHHHHAAPPMSGAAASSRHHNHAPTGTAAGSPTARISNGFPTDSRRGSAHGPAHSASRGGSAALHRLDRDDSARSDVSALSVTSVDMAEFLADFRAAHFSLFGSSSSEMTIDDLADIVDRVAFPIPDTRVLSDLFLEMDAVMGAGTVPFSAFLARMSYRIAGKYHMDLVRTLFFALAKVSVSDVEMKALEKRFEDASELAALVEEDAAVRSATAASGPGSTLVSPLTKGADGLSAVAMTPAAAATPSTILACATISAELSDLGDVVLRGIGLRVTPTVAEDILARIGLAVVEHRSVSLHLLDLARFLSHATALLSAPAASHSAACSVQQHPSVGADLCEMGV